MPPAIAFRTGAVLVLVATALALPSARARAQSDSLPKFGEYVHVEVLPELVTKVAPVYPYVDRRIEGTVVVQVLVGTDGRVKDTRVVKSIPMLDETAVECVRQWTFKPALTKNQPVAVWVVVPVKFGDDSTAPSGAVPPPGPGPTPADRGGRRVKRAEPLDFAGGLAALHALGAVVPTRADAETRRDLFRATRELQSPPAVPDSARLPFERGRAALATSGSRDSLERARTLIVAAIAAAPWWGEPYLGLADALEPLGDLAGALLCLDLYRQATPGAAGLDDLSRRMGDIKRRLGGSPKSPGR